MIDSMTNERMIVSTDGGAGPYIMLPFDQLDAVTRTLREHQVDFWVDSDAVSIDGDPEITFINFGRAANAGEIQRILDEAQ